LSDAFRRFYEARASPDGRCGWILTVFKIGSTGDATLVVECTGTYLAFLDFGYPRLLLGAGKGEFCATVGDGEDLEVSELALVMEERFSARAEAFFCSPKRLAVALSEHRTPRLQP
jgi:hypothetical protein